MTTTEENRVESLAPSFPEIRPGDPAADTSAVDDGPATAVAAPARPAPARRRFVVGERADLPDGGRLAVKIGRREVAVLNVKGELFALPERCPHQFAPLSRGRIQGTVICDETTGWKTEWAHDDEILVCPGHGMEFNIRTGRCIGYDFSLRTYQVQFEGDDVVLFV